VSQYIAEQVSHRPPVTAIYFENRKNHIVFDGQVWTQSRFSAPQTAKSILVGGARILLTNLEEEYYVTFPTYYCHNLIMGTMRMEVGDHADIVCAKTGYSAHIDFHQKPMWGGADKLNALTGVIRHGDSEVATVEGHWDSVIHITPTRGAKTVLIDVTTTPVMPKYVLPEALQGPWESRRLWHKAATLLNCRPVVDWDAVNREKEILEEDQRKLECHRHEEPSPWHTKLFHPTPFKNPITHTVEPLHRFMFLNEKPYEGEEPDLNLLWLSQTLPDLRSPAAAAPATAPATAPPAGGAGTK